MALDNFESSLCVIHRIESHEISPGITSKVCLNIGMIQMELKNQA